MSTLSHPVSDTTTMLRRSLRHTARDPSTMIASLVVPVLLLLLFVGVFGGVWRAGFGTGSTGGNYLDFIVPGILVITAAYGSSSTSFVVNRDKTEGIIARFRTMAISRASVLTGHVFGASIRTMISMGLVIGVSVLMGFRPTSDLLRWIATIGVSALLALALIWLAAAIGLLAKTSEGTASFGVVIQLLPFVSSGFVPTESMPGALRWFAQNQPFTPIIDTLRGLLTGTPIGNSAAIAVAWCVGLALAGYLSARALFNRDPIR